MRNGQVRSPELSQKLREVGSPSHSILLASRPFSPCALTQGLWDALLNHWKNTCLSGWEEQESKRASRLGPDLFDSQAHSLETSPPLCYGLNPNVCPQLAPEKAGKRGLCLFVCFLAATVGKARARGGSERDMVHEGHRTIISPPFSLMCFLYLSWWKY